MTLSRPSYNPKNISTRSFYYLVHKNFPLEINPLDFCSKSASLIVSKFRFVITELFGNGMATKLPVIYTYVCIHSVLMIYLHN